MAAGSKKTTKRSTSSNAKKAQASRKPVRRELAALIFFILAVIAALGLFGVRAMFIDFLYKGGQIIVGVGAYLLPASLLWSSIILLFHRGLPVSTRVWCTMLAPILLGAVCQLAVPTAGHEWSGGLIATLAADGQAGAGGGVIGGLLSMAMYSTISHIGAGIILITTLTLLVLTSVNRSLPKLIEMIRNRERPAYEVSPVEPRPKRVRAPEREPEPVPSKTARKRGNIDIPLDDKPVDERDPAKPQPEPVSFLKPRAPEVRTPAEAVVPEEEVSLPVELASEPEVFEETDTYSADYFGSEPADDPYEAEYAAPRPEPNIADEQPELVIETSRGEIDYSTLAAPYAHSSQYCFPPVTLLCAGNPHGAADPTEELATNATRLTDTIKSFNIEARIINVTRGPSVTRYELEMDKGVKLSRLTGLSDDIALSLGASGVRIAPIPDKIAVIGIEVPNKIVSTVYVRDIIDSPEFLGGKSKISFAIGKDIAGDCIVGDIARLPHLLIAGTTGSGKSVCMNTLIISLLYKASPDDVRLIMIDPKMIELGIYNGIPHLLIPVVTDPKKASGALQWAVVEMMRRYKLFAEKNVRDIFSYNEAAARDSAEVQKLPQIVIVIDELADLMLVAAKEVEESICRIAQMARAAGMHLIIATQRPSSDVITGIMKANIPSRIAFAVASQLESRIILDSMGAEKLVGRGDMLFAPLGSGKPTRVQGALISSDEVESVVEFVKKYGAPDYSDDVMAQIEKSAEPAQKGGGATLAPDDSADDELLAAAVDVFLEIGQASSSLLQRRLKVGYARAARLVDMMEERGIVGPNEGSKPRQILISRDRWQEMKQEKGL